MKKLAILAAAIIVAGAAWTVPAPAQVSTQNPQSSGMFTCKAKNTRAKAASAKTFSGKPKRTLAAAQSAAIYACQKAGNTSCRISSCIG